MKMPDAVTRAVRTFFQSATGVFLSFMVVPHLNNANAALPSLSTLHAAVFSAAFAGVIAVLTYLHNSLEDLGAVPVIGKVSAVDKVVASSVLDAAIKQVQNQAVIYGNSSTAAAVPTALWTTFTATGTPPKPAVPAPAASNVGVAGSAVEGATVSTEPPAAPVVAEVAPVVAPEVTPPAAV